MSPKEGEQGPEERQSSGTPPHGDTAPGDTARTPQPHPAACLDPRSIISSSPRGSRGRARGKPEIFRAGQSHEEKRRSGMKGQRLAAGFLFPSLRAASYTPPTKSCRLLAPQGNPGPVHISPLSLRSSALAHCVTSSLKPKKKQETGLF